jgi:hypothetical protein
LSKKFECEIWARFGLLETRTQLWPLHFETVQNWKINEGCGEYDEDTAPSVPTAQSEKLRSWQSTEAARE